MICTSINGTVLRLEGRIVGLIPQTKCSRCDRKYSGLRSRCPYCGARRRKKGKRVSDTDNSTWKLIIGVLLLVVLIAAVVVLLVTSLSGNDNSADENTPPENNGGISSNEGVTQLPGSDPEQNGDDTTNPDGTIDENTPDTDPVPEATINSVSLYTQYGNAATDISISVGVTEPISYVTSPEDVDLQALGITPEWSSSDENVFVVLQDGSVTGVGVGDATLTLTLGDITAECIIRVRS